MDIPLYTLTEEFKLLGVELEAKEDTCANLTKEKILEVHRNIWDNTLNQVRASKGIGIPPEEIQFFMQELQINLHDQLFVHTGVDFNDLEKITEEKNLDKDPEFQA